MRFLIAILAVFTISTSAIAINGTPIERSIDKVVVVNWYNPDGKTQKDQGGLGTGFVYDSENGYIVTNHHVVAGAIKTGTDIMITFYKGVDLRDQNLPVVATVVGYDEMIDLAVLQVPSAAIKDRNIRQVQFDLYYELGDDVYIIGHPNGLTWSVSKGILSNLQRRGINPETRRVIYWQRLLQTDAALNSGNSGGPVFDRHGKVTGVAVSIISPNGGSVGLGMIIEGLLAKKVIEDIIVYGKYRTPFFGISFDTSNMEAGDLRPVVKDVVDGSSVDGLFLPGDIILNFDKYSVFTVEHLFFYISYLHVGDTIDFTVLRNGEEIKIRNVLIKAKPAEKRSY